MEAHTIGLCLRVIDLYSHGNTITHALRTLAIEGTPLSYAAFNRAVRTVAEIGALYEEAQQAHFDTLRDKLVDADSELSRDPKMAAVLSKNIQFVLSKMRPKEYGDKVQVEHTVKADGIIVAALARAKNRALPSPIIDAVAEEIVATAVDECDMSFLD